MKFSVLISAFLGVMILSSVARTEESYTEPGRYGFEWAVTEDTVFLGPTYKAEDFEGAFFLSGHQYSDGSHADSWVANARIGYRKNLGSHNYLGVGLLANMTVLGHDYGSGIGASFNNTKGVTPNDGVNIAGSGREGPYLAIERHFPHSGVFVEIAVMIYAYQTNIMNNGQGEKVVTHDNRFLESGYVGIGYLFGTSGDDLK